MNTKAILSLSICLIMLSVRSYTQEIFQSQRLTKLWETKNVLKTPESALYDAKRKIIYVSSMSGKEPDGFISKISPNGEIVKLDWVTGLNGPKGLGIYKDKLYVTARTEVDEISIAEGKVLKRYKNIKAKDLNDISVSKDGTVYASDTGSKCIFIMGKDSLEVLVESPETNRCNGALVNGNDLLVGGSHNRVAAIDLKTKAIRTFVDSTGYVDGLASIGDGSFITSDWKGKVQIIQPGKPIQKLLDTSPAKINAADLDYIVKDSIIIIPTFNDNRLVAYKLKF